MKMALVQSCNQTLCLHLSLKVLQKLKKAVNWTSCFFFKAASFYLKNLFKTYTKYSFNVGGSIPKNADVVLPYKHSGHK